MNPGNFGFPRRPDWLRFNAPQTLTPLQRLTALRNGGAVSYADAQSLTAAEQGQARANISVREALIASRTYFVRTAGNDSNNGLSSGAAFLTIARALAVLPTIDFNGFVVTVDIGAGTWAERINIPRCVGTAAVTSLVFVGAGATTIISPSTGGFEGSVSATGGNVVGTFQSMRIQNTSTNGVGIFAQDAAALNLGSGVEIGACSFTGITAAGGAAVRNTAALTFTGGGQCAIRAQYGGYFGAGASINFGTNSFTSATVISTFGTAEFFAGTPSGTVTGKRYDATLNGVIQTYGGGANYIPGSIAGTVATGGQYA